MPDVYTLAEHLQTSKDPLEKGVIQAILERVNIMETLPFVTTGALSVKVTRWKVLPAPGFRALNDVFTSTSGLSEQLEESVYIAGGNIDMDRQFSDDKNSMVDPRTNQLNMFMAAMAYLINDYFINGDTATTPNGFDGVKVRVGNLPARQVISASTAANGLDVKASDANMHTFLDKVDELIDVIEDGAADALLMNTKTRLGLRSVLRRQKLYETTRDMFDRDVMVYRGARIYDMGVTATGAFSGAAANYILPQTEAYTGGGTADGTSIYAVRFGRDGGEYLHGWDKHKLEVKDLGLLENGAQKRTNIEWPLGLALWNPRALARLRDISWDT